MTASSDSESLPENAGTSTPATNARPIKIPAPVQLGQRPPVVVAEPNHRSPPSISDARTTSNAGVTSDAVSSRFLIDTQQSPIDLPLTQRLKRNRKSLSSMMASFIFHVIWVVVLLLLASSSNLGPQPISITATIESVPADNPLESFTPAEIITEVIEPFDSPVENTDQSLDQSLESTAAELETVAVPTVAITPTIPTNAESDSNPVVDSAAAPVTGGGIEGRDPSSRAAIAAVRGGTPQSEQAVESGLRWIIEHQNRYDGGWSFQQSCKQCRHDGHSQSDNAATGLSLMALLGAGYTHKQGPYQQNVQMGLDALLRYQSKRKSEFGGPFVDVSAAGMYTHAIATIAVADAYAMTGDRSLEESCKLAHQYILNAQHRGGGWRYRPNSRGDMLVTGWQVLALKSLQRCGIETPKPVWQRTVAFVNSLEVSDGTAYRYYFSEPRSRDVPTAVGLLNQMYLKWPRDRQALDRGASNLIDRRVSKDDIYFNFYSTLLLHHLQHEGWEYWNTEVRERLIKTQATRGHEAGSWHFKHQHGDVGGRLYTTAMAVMTLEVYYRYSPLFGSKDVLKEKDPPDQQSTP